jgi:hypothetical protein
MDTTINAIQETMEVMIHTGQEQVRTEINTDKEEMKPMGNSIQSEFEETISKQVKGIPASVDQWTQSLEGIQH